MSSPGAPADPRRSMIVALFAVSIFASAFLLFQVQPMVGKRILPWFGGVPGVWTVCLGFYQGTLFLGYAYAHLLERRVAPRWQPVVHAALFAAAIASLPALPGAEWKPSESSAPTGRILAMLASNVGLPFLFLAASGPLIQAWFVRAARDRSPYVLYAVSNAGSFLALLSYPFLIEPAVPLSAGSRIWAVALVVAGAGVVACAWLARDAVAPAGAPRSGGDEEPLDATRTLSWIALSACAVVLLMGVTNELCLDVASIPFLWVAPLALYLLTFIVCFSAEAPPSRPWLVALAGASLAALLAVGAPSLVSVATGAPDVAALVGLYALVLLTHCLVLHRELYALRPGPERLTAYYLCISFGGAVGGLFVGLGAPRWFADYYETPIGLVGCWLLLSLCWLREVRVAPGTRRALVVAATAASAFALVALVRPAPVGLGSVILQVRNFFGVLRVVEISKDDPREHRRVLKSGTTLHGLQFVEPPRRGTASLYYAESTGIGVALRHATQDQPVRVGVVGLGVGTLAVYGRAGDVFRFYEIDPDVIGLARDSGYFGYLAEADAQVSITAGDARLSLEREFAGPDAARLDLLVLDAFTSDAIPVHLLTAEAFRVYDRALQPNGMLAFHVTNANLELTPLVLRLGAELGFRGLVVENRQTAEVRRVRATWVLLSRDEASLGAVEQAIAARHANQPVGMRNPWLVRSTGEDVARAPRFTDDYSDVFSLLKSRPSGEPLE